MSERVIVGKFKPSLVVEFVILDRNVVDKFYSPCADWSDETSRFAFVVADVVEVAFVSFRDANPIKIRFILRISNPYIFSLLIGRIHNLKRITPNKLIIPIDQHLYIILMTVIKCSIDNIIRCIISPHILHIFDPILWKFDKLHVLDTFLHGLICRAVIDEHYVIVLVFLLGDWDQHF